ncbi:hypothetical protein M758_3G222700 [Ceratodon purpureus]|nr:hypothetical protein M758_3G222700 [Ceratodon purpureus]
MVAFQSLMEWQARSCVLPNAIPRVGPPCKSRIARPVCVGRIASASSQVRPKCTSSTPSPSSSSIRLTPFRCILRRSQFQMDSSVSCRAQKQENEVQEAATPKVLNDSSQPDILQGWPKVALSLFGFGFLLGPLLDGIHSRVELQIYDRGAIDIAGLHTNIWVFPMLGLFYSVVGVLQLVLDKYLARKGNLPTADLPKVVFSSITLATLLEVSAELYKAGTPFNIEAYTLFALAEANWLVFENTWWGFGLATLVGIACPLAEVPINKLFGLWHYPQGNVEIFGESTVTWVLACYFFYTPFISNLARYLSSLNSTTSPPKRLD